MKSETWLMFIGTARFFFLNAARKSYKVLELYEWKRSRTVLRGERGRKPPDLLSYYPIVSRLGGQVIKLSPTSAQYINPMDINADYDDEDPLTLKSDFILSLCELIVGGKEGLAPAEKTIIDRCVRLVYRPYLANPKQSIWGCARKA